MARNKRDDAVRLVLKDIAERKAYQTEWVEKVEQRRRAYMGLLEARSQAAQWTSKLTPPYVMQIVEGVVANLVDDRTRFMVRARPRMAAQDELERLVAGARALEILLSYQLDADGFNRKQRPFIMQALITGMTAAKVYWKRRNGTLWERSYVPYVTPAGDPVIGEDGNQKLSLQRTKREGLIVDDPTFEVVDVRDLFWEEAATSIENSWVAHRVYTTMEELRDLEKQGVYKNVSDLTVVGDESGRGGTVADEFASLERELWNEDRAKGRVELIEYWSRDSTRVITVGNRRVLLADESNEFEHQKKPFIVASTSPDLFRIPGLSLVEKVRPLQEYLWTLLNQRLDSLMLNNNAIFLVQEMLDVNQFDAFPGAIWPVPDPNSVKWFTPDPQVGRVSIEAEALIKGDMQNITGGMPFMAGVEAQIDQKTATGVSIITSIAQRMVAHQKQHVYWAFEEFGDMLVSLNQQYMTSPRLVAIVGEDGMNAFREVFPDEIQGDYHVNLEATSESLMRQERRAEAQALLTVAANVASVVHVLAQAKAQSGLPARTINMEALWENVLRAFDVDDVERYFSPVTAAAPPAPGGGGGGNSMGLPDQGPPGQDGLINSGGGVTSELASGPLSPSSPTSLSGEAAMQRLLAMSGGSNNAP